MSLFNNRLNWLFLVLLLLPVTVMGQTTRTLQGGCMLRFGGEGGATLTATILEQDRLCQVPDKATLLEISISADAGTPSITLQRFRFSDGSTVDLSSSALTWNSGFTCMRATASTSINGKTACASGLTNTAFSPGDWINVKTGALPSTAAMVSIAVTWQW